MTFWTPAPGGPTWGSHPGALQPAMSGFAPAPLSCFSGSKVSTSNPTGLLFKLQLHHRPPDPSTAAGGSEPTRQAVRPSPWRGKGYLHGVDVLGVQVGYFHQFFTCSAACGGQRWRQPCGGSSDGGDTNGCHGLGCPKIFPALALLQDWEQWSI